MRSLLRRVVVIGIFGLLAFLAASLLRGRGKASYAAERDRATKACRAFRSAPEHVDAPVCRAYDEFGRRSLGIFRRAEDAIKDAKVGVDRGDRRGAEAAVARAMSSARELDRMGTALAGMMAAKVVNGVLDFLATHPWLDRTTLLREATLEIAKRPLEGERVHHGWMLAHWNETAGAPFTAEGALADAMARDDEAYREMDRALLAGDAAACERAARAMESGAARSGVPLVLCKKMPEVVRAGRRLDEARRQAR